MLISEIENVGKQIYRENIIYHGTQLYYALIRKLKNEQTI